MLKKTMFVAILCTLGAVPTWAGLHGTGWDGGTARWDRLYYQGQGGEFTLSSYSSTQPLLLSNSAYASSTRGQNAGHPESFQTFCLETDEFVANPMSVGVSESSVDQTTGIAGAYGSGSHTWLGGSNSNFGDNLDPMTAYLYTQFARGQLAGYAYTGTVGGLTRAQTAGALQRLFWATEGEGGSNFAASFMGISLNSLQQALIRQWTEGFQNSDWEGIGKVRVLQLTWGDGNTQFKQDQLFLTPIPGAVLLGFLGLGAAGLKLRRFA